MNGELVCTDWDTDWRERFRATQQPSGWTPTDADAAGALQHPAHEGGLWVGAGRGQLRRSWVRELGPPRSPPLVLARPPVSPSVGV